MSKKQFVAEIENSDNSFELEYEYKSKSIRYFGPAVRCEDFDELVDLIRATTVELQLENNGYEYIVFPK